MQKVYFKEYSGNDYAKLSQIGKELLEKLLVDNNIELASHVPIKVHFGEKGNNTYIPPECYKGIIESLDSKGIKSSYIETNVLYRGERTTASNHINLAKDHGFTQLPIIIADGEMGEDVSEVEINKKYYNNIKIGKAFSDYNQVVVVSHFKGHGLAGFGGALKQLAMGFASRSGKMAQHSKMVPSVSSTKCIGCGICVKKCDVDAIKLKSVAHINEDKCVGSAGCIAVCPEKAITNDWGASNFREKLAEYAYGAQLDKEHLYISFLINITKECDCIGKPMDSITPNIGVMASMDPVALDWACIDKVQEQTGDQMFDKGKESLYHADKINFGSKKYILVEV